MERRRCYIYLRKVLNGYDSGYDNLEIQESRLRKKAKDGNLRILGVCTEINYDKESLQDRPVLKELMDKIKFKDIIMFYSIKHLSSNREDGLHIRLFIKNR